MTLIDERELVYEQEKKQKLFKLITKTIIVLVIIGIILVVYMNISKNNQFKCYINNKLNLNVSDNLLYKDSKGKVFLENGKVFISVRELSSALEYQFYNSEYKRKGEDRTKCQVKVGNIYTSYVANSNNIYKAIPEVNQSNSRNKENENSTKTEFEYFTVADKVKYENEELYASIEAIQLGFDVSITYNPKNNTLTIDTLDNLQKAAKNARKDVVDASEYSYKNKRLLKYGMAIVKDSDGNIGVASYTDTNKKNSYVASCKYSKIDFNEGTKTLETVTSKDNKAGLLYLNINNQEVEKNMEPQYEEIKEMTNNFDYFLIKQNDKYGMINSNGITILPTVFESIGIREEDYSDITCKYIIQGRYIPVKQNGKWGLYSIEGTKLIEPQYEDIGCSLVQSGDSAVIIPNIKENVNGVVFLYNTEKGFYGIYNADTGEKIALSLTEVFKKNENGEDNYYANHIIDRATSRAHTIDLKNDL